MKFLLLLFLLLPINIKAYDKSIVDINDLSIKELQAYVDKGYLNYEKITQLYLDRIDAYNEQYNALITINENALNEARKLDDEYKKKGRRSLIHGLPIIVKDNIDVKGLPTTNGTKALLDSYPFEDATVVKTLRDNGAIVIAKSNLDEFAFNANFSHSSFGYTLNAYNPKYSSYGSSGGSAVSVAANLSVFALGTDTGCSIRVPSSANGVVGLRPTYDLLSSNGVIKLEETRDTIGIITKYVTDNAIVLDILDNKNINYNDYLNKPINNIKIGVIKGFMNPYTNSNSCAYGKTDKFIYDMMNESIKKLEDMGAEIVYLDNFYLNYIYDDTTLCYNFNQYIKNTSSKIKSLNDLIKSKQYTQYINGYNNIYCNIDYKETNNYKNYLNKRNNNIQNANNKFDKYNLDAIIYPTLKNKLFTLEESKYKKIHTPSSETAPLIGFPAISLPMGINDGLPYGIEIMAKNNNEHIIYQIASNFETNNMVYKTPSIVPSLYEIPEEINKLIEKYDNSNNQNINNMVKKYFLNFDGDVQNINKHINLYNEIKLEEKNHKNYNFIFIGLIIILLGKVIYEKIKRTN